MNPKMSKNWIVTAIAGAIITILIGLGFMQINVSQETNARNIEEIPRILNRLETLEAESDRYRIYYLELAEKLAKNEARIETVIAQQDSLRERLIAFFDRFSRLEDKIINFILKEK